MFETGSGTEVVEQALAEAGLCHHAEAAETFVAQQARQQQYQ